MTFEIFIPFYGRVDHFKEAVESVLAQEDPDWKLTVVDDVYPDTEPGLWLKSLGDRRIKYILNSENLRPSKNYNKCVNLCSSEFIMLMGCDDAMMPNFVSNAKKLINQFPEVDIIQPGVEVMTEKSEASRPIVDRVKQIISPRTKGPHIYSGEMLASSLLTGNWTYFPSLIWRTKLLRNFVFRTDLDVVQDLAMIMQIVMSGGNMLVDDKIAFRYRRHSTSLSSVTGPDGSKFKQERRLFTELQSPLQKLGWHKAAKIARVHIFSKANAFSELPGALLKKNKEGISTLTRHVLGLKYKKD
jgi:glycosyltransferase involved in cell wall biosynthesis